MKSQTYSPQGNLQTTVDLHTALANAYDFVRSVEMTQSVAAVTLDSLLQDHINVLQQGTKTQLVDTHGRSLGARESKWDQLNELRQQFTTVIQEIQKAGNSESKLRALGIFEVDQETVPGTGSSSSATNSGGRGAAS